MNRDGKFKIKKLVFGYIIKLKMKNQGRESQNNLKGLQLKSFLKKKLNKYLKYNHKMIWSQFVHSGIVLPVQSKIIIIRLLLVLALFVIILLTMKLKRKKRNDSSLKNKKPLLLQFKYPQPHSVYVLKTLRITEIKKLLTVLFSNYEITRNIRN